MNVKNNMVGFMETEELKMIVCVKVNSFNFVNMVFKKKWKMSEG